MGVLYLDFMRANHILGIDNIKVSSLTRLVSTPFVRKQIGLDIKKGIPKYLKDMKDIISNLSKVSNAMGETDFNVGVIHNADQREEWIRVLLTRKDFMVKVTSDTATHKENNIEEKKPEQTSPTDRQTLIPSPFQINISHEKINSIYFELRKLKIEEFRNSVAVLFRVFFELSLDHFISKESAEIRLPKRTTLKIKMELVSNYMENNNLLTKNELKPIRTAASNVNSIFSPDTFNSYVHSLHYIPEAKDLKYSWDNMKKFIQKLWE